VNKSVTMFLGVRYEVVGAWHEKSLTLANFLPVDGGHHVVPNAQIAALLPPGLIALNRTETADQAGLPETLVNTDKNNFSPRFGFAWRLDQSNKTVLRGGFGLFHPTVAVQGVRDLLATNEFRYSITRRGPVSLAHGFSQGNILLASQDYGSEGVDPNIKSPDIYQYNLTYEQALPGNFGLRLSYIGSTMRGLLVNRFENDLRASTTPFDPENEDDLARLPLFPIVNTFTNLTYSLGKGQLHAAQIELQRSFRSGLGFNVAYTFAHSDSNAPDSGNSSLGVLQTNSFDIEMDRGPDPNVVKHRVWANAPWEIPVGRNRSHGANMPRWANALFGGWTVSTIFQ